MGRGNRGTQEGGLTKQCRDRVEIPDPAIVKTQMKISKYRFGQSLVPGTFVPAINIPFIQQPSELASRKNSILFIKPFSKRDNVSFAHLSDNPKGLVCILSERIPDWTNDYTGVLIEWNRDRLCGGRVIRRAENLSPVFCLNCNRFDENYIFCERVSVPVCIP